MCIALGADLFDSAAYALFARDNRLLTPDGTVKLGDLTEWPHTSSVLFPYTPKEVREMEKDERSTLLAHHNLEVTQAELARCREAVRNGTIWQLAEQRSHANAKLREAFEWVLEQLEESDEGPVAESVLRTIASSDPIRGSAEQFSEDIDSRPHLLHLNALLAMRWRRPGSWWDGSDDKAERVVILSGAEPPWRDSALGSAISALEEEPRSIILISTPVGLIPFTLEDVSPWCHIQCPDDLWDMVLDEAEIDAWLEDLGIADLPLDIHVCQADPEGEAGGENRSKIRDWIDRCTIVDKLSLLCGISPSDVCKLSNEMTSRRSRTDRMVNVNFGGVHCLSPRLPDGALSLTLAGAKKLHELNPKPPSTFQQGTISSESNHPGLPRVLLMDDAIPFVGKGRNVIHGFVLGADPHLIVGQPCLVVSAKGELIAHGVANATADDMAFFDKGIAVKVRDGALK
jgi:7-cyano-7-deazaguanine tRNA-ribosyltransferase